MAEKEMRNFPLRDKESSYIHRRAKAGKKPKGAPAWKPDKTWKPIVKNVGVEMLAEL